MKSHVRTWLTIPVSGTLEIVTLTQQKFGLSLILLSSQFTQCQVTFRQSMKHSKNADIRQIYTETRRNTNIQYDCYQSTRDAIKSIRNKSIEKVSTQLTTPKLVISSIWLHAVDQLTKYWFKTVTNLPSGIYNFVMRYLSNTSSNATNMFKWNVTSTNTCVLCNNAQTLGHIIAGCTISLQEKRYNWRHDSILSNIMSLIPRNTTTKIYADLPDSTSPSIITGDEYRPDIVIVTNNHLWIVELTAGFETNIQINYDRKQQKYHNLINCLKLRYHSVRYVNLSMGACGVIGSDSGLKDMLLSLMVDDASISYHISRIINVCIRSTYYLFCMRNKKWENPNLLVW